MLEIKFHKGFVPSYPVEKETFKKQTGCKYPYVQNNEWYAYCPHCENPVKLLGILKPLVKQKSHARHQTHNVNDLGNYNEIKYEFCPYHRKNADYVREIRSGEETDYDIEIYNIMRKHFDQAIYILRKILPIYLSNRSAERLLKEYISYKGWMFIGADEDNIPLMLLNAMSGLPIYGMLVKNDSKLYKFLKKRKEIDFIPSDCINGYSKVTKRNNKYINLDFIVTNIRFRVDDDTRLHNIIKINIAQPDGKGTYETIYEEEIKDSKPYAFRHLVHSKSDTLVRNEKLLDIAKELMPPM